MAANHNPHPGFPRRTQATTPYMGSKCLACGLTGLQAMSLASLDKKHDGCQGRPGRRHHFPSKVQA